MKLHKNVFSSPCNLQFIAQHQNMGAYISIKNEWNLLVCCCVLYILLLEVKHCSSPKIFLLSDQYIWVYFVLSAHPQQGYGSNCVDYLAGWYLVQRLKGSKKKGFVFNIGKKGRARDSCGHRHDVLEMYLRLNILMNPISQQCLEHDSSLLIVLLCMIGF